jgi:ABC-2 type transport system ATP-binding protein
MNPIVEVQGLTKAYRDVHALDNVSFTLSENKIYGLLGRNGAGKTTLMRIITAQVFATAGTVRVFGETPYENDRVLRRICFIKESQKYPDTFRIADVLETAASVFPNWDRELALSLAEQFRLPLKRKMKNLSRGMHSSVGIVIGLASRAPLTIFDEPYLGLDAVARTLFYDRLLEDYAEYPRTIVLSTHLIDEVSRLLEHIFVIDGGRLILDEDADALRGRAFTVVGPAARVDALTSRMRPIDRTMLGGLVSATFWGKLDADERRRLEAEGLELAPVSLQQMIVRLTNGKFDGKAVSGE